ncbi:hypothetical protein ACFQHV_15760 [Promicromonospora thailandica]|uniref:hypothetical protein n=1 Tax=Promicromonospora thailandica TaxID=765201 RepID=UPI0020A56D83|nr:hypothetical protein [Promicromonospora thailandica]BFF20300.1 hypothetical protein GCM10025730_38210 [Promicromonospora thailandica]
MERKPQPPNPEFESRGETTDSRRFGYFLKTNPVAVVDTWEMYSNRLSAYADWTSVNSDAEDTRNIDEFHEAEDVGTVFSRELPEFAKAYPRQAAELVAEILHRDDHAGSFHLWTGSARAILYIAASDRELGIQLWDMFRELSEPNVNEAAIDMQDAVDPRIPHELSRELRDIEQLRRKIEHQDVDRVAMMLFYVEHVKPYA